MSTVARELYLGHRNANPEEWYPFEYPRWSHAPDKDMIAFGELCYFRPSDTGTLMCGLWRTGPNMPGILDTGRAHFPYSNPYGDETCLILEGETVLTVQQTQKRYHLKAGDIFSHPKDLDVWWEPQAPFFKKFWTISNGPNRNPQQDDLFIGNIAGNTGKWNGFELDDPNFGAQAVGEQLTIRSVGASGSLQVALWRAGRGLPGCDANGAAQLKSSTALGDESGMVLEGEAIVTNQDTGTKHHFKAGDIFSVAKGTNLVWETTGPFFKKYSVIADEARP
jgi:uncharacterized cupin superfamily protein